MVIDDSGNLFLTVVSISTNFNADFYTAKYAAADGALIWEQRYDGPRVDIYPDVARAVAVDTNGNVVVTGYSYGTNFNGDYYTAKYAAADGALLWEQRYNGPGNLWDEPRAVAVDGSGNVVVTGSSASSGSAFGGVNADYYAAKYAAVDGALLWEQRYDGPGNGDDFAYALAVDGSGNVVVMGSSFGTNINYNFGSYTAKYAATDGALLWERRDSDGVGWGDSERSIAVDSSGNVAVTG